MWTQRHRLRPPNIARHRSRRRIRRKANRRPGPDKANTIADAVVLCKVRWSSMTHVNWREEEEAKAVTGESESESESEKSQHGRHLLLFVVVIVCKQLVKVPRQHKRAGQAPGQGKKRTRQDRRGEDRERRVIGEAAPIEHVVRLYWRTAIEENRSKKWTGAIVRFCTVSAFHFRRRRNGKGNCEIISKWNGKQSMECVVDLLSCRSNAASLDQCPGAQLPLKKLPNACASPRQSKANRFRWRDNSPSGMCQPKSSL